MREQGLKAHSSDYLKTYFLSKYYVGLCDTMIITKLCISREGGIKMALIECKTCGKQISENSKVCPHCGEPIISEVKIPIWAWFIIIILTLGVIGAILGLQPDNVQKTSFSSSQINVQQYKILKDEKKRDIKRVVQVILKERVSEQLLKDIAQKIKQSDSRSYQRTLIGYFLSQSNKDLGYWATTDFNPYLEVKIYGTTLKREKLLTKKVEVNPDRKIIGTWMYDGALGLTKMTFFTDKDDKLFLERTFDDGGKILSNISEIGKSNLGRKLIDEKKYKNYGEYYLLTPNGKVEYWDNQGLLYTAKKL